MYFGITRRQVAQAGIVGAVMASLLFVLFLYVGLAHGTVRGLVDALAVAGLSLLIGAALPLFVGTAAVLGIRVVDGQVEQILFGPAFTEDGTLNLVGAIRTCMGSVGAQNIKELQQTELIIAPSIKTEGKVFQRAQKLGSPR